MVRHNYSCFNCFILDLDNYIEISLLNANSEKEYSEIALDYFIENRGRFQKQLDFNCFKKNFIIQYQN